VLPPDFVATLVGSHRWASLRPEAIRLAEFSGREAHVAATSFLGGSTRLALDLGGLRIHALVPSVATLPEVGERIHIDWDEKDLHLMEEGD
jgi:putative spermidine/putrescine transport system ATP-binding protein